MLQTCSQKSKILWLLGTVVLVWANLSFRDLAFGQQIQPDTTLGAESSVVTSGVIINNNVSNLVTVGAVRGANLFHSFKEFNISAGQRVYFNNPAGVERIIARVTGGSRSIILGRLGVIGGTADLFLLNPNGIIFGPNASLDLKGSFLATTASSYIFSNSEYSAIEPSSFPILSVNIPLGLRFRNGAGEIVNQSRASDPRRVGLQVSRGKTLALVGGNITMEGGGLTAPEGRIELGSIVGSGQVTLREGDWAIGYEGIQNSSFGDINLRQGSFVVSRGNNGGSIDLHGRNVIIADESFLFSSVVSGLKPSSIKITASDSFELVSGSSLVTSTFGDADGGDVLIKAKKIFLRDRAYIQSASSFIGSTKARGNAGNISILSEQIEISGGALINASTLSSGKGGNILINSSESINIFGVSSDDGRSSGLFASSESSSGGQAGNIILKTRFLRVADGATVNVSSVGQGTAGNIDIFARSVLLENRGSIDAETKGGEGNITFHEANDIILRNNSRITTNATDSANGGNITINTGVLLALSPTGSEGSDIVARADRGRGGNIVINAKGIFGIKKRIANPGNRTNDIDASSQFGLSGQVDINTAIDPNNGLIELPETVVDPDYQVAQNPCNRGWGNEFTVSGRGGLPPSPSQDLNSEATQIKLVEPVQASNGTQNNSVTPEKTSSLNSVPAAIAPAQGWVYNKKGQVVLVAYNPTATGAQRLKASPAGCPVP